MFRLICEYKNSKSIFSISNKKKSFLPFFPCREISKLESLEFLDIFGVLSDQALTILTNNFPDVGINKYKHSAVARPTVGTRRTSIWGLRTRD